MVIQVLPMIGKRTSTTEPGGRRRHATHRLGGIGSSQAYRFGISSFLMRGFDPIADPTEFGRELIPRIKAGAIEVYK